MQKKRPLRFWLKLTSVTIVATLAMLLFLSAASLALAVTVPLKMPLCCQTPASFGAEYQPVAFSTANGLVLRGWYIPPRNGAVILLVHSYYGNRLQTLPVAEMLYRHGYGILMYDQRASGESDGNTRSLGWLDIPDLGAAAAFVTSQAPRAQIGAFGCSSGGAIALAGAAQTSLIAAIAIDAPSPLHWREAMPPFDPRQPFQTVIMGLYYPLVMLRAGTLPPTTTTAAIGAYGPRPILFLSTGQEVEQARVQAYFDLATGPKKHANFATSSHCAAPLTHPAEYERHLVEFFNAALLNP